MTQDQTEKLPEDKKKKRSSSVFLKTLTVLPEILISDDASLDLTGR